MTDTELKVLINAERWAMDSLLAFRERFIPAKDDVKPAVFHEEWSKILLNGAKNFAVEAFRESAKTQIVIRANLLHALTYPREGRSYLVVICATQRTASKKLLEVSREYLNNTEMHGLMKEVRENSGLAFEVSYHTGQSVRIEAYGKGAAVRGLSWGAKRPDLVIIDDPQDEEDARSETVTASDWDWFLSDVYFLGQASRIFIIGNNLGERCIMECIMRNAERLNFAVAKIPILTKDGKSAWPEKWPLSAIEKDRDGYAALGKMDIWYRNKMCECISPASQKFKREYFRYYEVTPSLSELNVYTTVDLAISEKVNADYSAIVTVGVNSAGHWFILDVEYGRYDPTTTMDAVFSAVQKWRPLTVGIEAVAYQSALLHFLEKEMPQRGIFFRVTPLKAEKKKELRIDTLQPRFAVGSVWMKTGAVWLSELENELLAYPHGAKDDVIDALAYVEQMSAQPFAMRGFEGVSDEWNPIAGRM
ncbi:MAG: phage terminase large subunit [Synergistaceae bacterium]|nr:phage terminase large subunit [Synergistaceae bacterium]MBQ3446241.1 phage terminase large subunit [Synergistaceae bacterium]MBQ6665895.1 phage terminase large subunit [Synergistaceae bacterium]